MMNVKLNLLSSDDTGAYPDAVVAQVSSYLAEPETTTGTITINGLSDLALVRGAVFMF